MIFILRLLNGAVSTSHGIISPITGLDRPLGLQEVETPRICRQSAYDDCKVASPTHRPLIPPPSQEMSLILISVRSRVDPRAIVQPEG